VFAERKKVRSMRYRNLIILFLIGFEIWVIPTPSVGQIINIEGWPIPDLRGMTPYSITIKEVDGVEKVVEKFYTPSGGHVARISGNNKIYAYIVDKDQEPPIDYILLDIDGLGKFTQRLGPKDSYLIPEWVSR
jgi:hypothetical protein